MIVDTSALIAVILRERGDEPIRAALVRERGLMPAPVLVEYTRLLNGRVRHRRAEGERLIGDILSETVFLEPMIPEDATLAAAEVPRLGKGSGGKLNLLDLMVYAVAKRTGLPVLCAGDEFAKSGLPVHPASRSD